MGLRWETCRTRYAGTRKERLMQSGRPNLFGFLTAYIPRIGLIFTNGTLMSGSIIKSQRCFNFNTRDRETAIWILLCCKTSPSISDLLLLPVLKRLMVVSLFPKASRKKFGNSADSNRWSANKAMASSISTASIFYIIHDQTTVLKESAQFTNSSAILKLGHLYSNSLTVYYNVSNFSGI